MRRKRFGKEPEMIIPLKEEGERLCTHSHHVPIWDPTCAVPHAVGILAQQDGPGLLPRVDQSSQVPQLGEAGIHGAHHIGGGSAGAPALSSEG